MLGLFFTEGPVRNFQDAKNSNLNRFKAYYKGMLEAGIYLAPSQFEALFVSAAHTPEDIDATVAAAAQAKGYLRRHGASFATTATETVAAAIAEGRPTDDLVNDLRLRLGVVKSRADVTVDIWGSEDLATWEKLTTTPILGSGLTTEFFHITTKPKYFLQVRTAE
jgi:hypothetical protein